MKISFINLVKIRTNLGKQSVSYSGACIWNTLRKEIRECSLNHEKCLDEHLRIKVLLEEYNYI